jgi:endoglucanase
MRTLDLVQTLALAGVALPAACSVVHSETWSPEEEERGPDRPSLLDLGPVPTSWVPEPAPDDSPVSQFGQLRVQGTELVSEAGEPVRLKGMSSMWLNWESDGYAESKPALEWMRDDWGLSLIRAAMGIEPSGAYLDNPTRARAQVRTVVRNAIEAGVYVLIDWHDHAAEEHEAEAIAFFRSVAEEFGHYPNVLYETYNEPEGGGSDEKPWVGLLRPYHAAVVGALREVDPDGIAILGTGQWSQRVDRVLEDPLDVDNVMYTVHFYSCTHRGTQRQQAATAYAQGLPIFVTEWGATDSDGGVDEAGDVCGDSGREWMTFLDERNLSWAAWKLDACGDLSCMFRPGAPRDGDWTDDMLNGHAPFVVEQMRR